MEKRTCLEEWKPSQFYWRATFMLMAGFAAITASTGLAIHFLLPDKWFSLAAIPGFFAVAATIAFAVLTLVAPLFCLKRKDESQAEYEKRMSEDVKMGWDFFRYGNPTVLPFVILLALANVARDIFRYLWRADSRWFIRFY